jgi:hypothetical protein
MGWLEFWKKRFGDTLGTLGKRLGDFEKKRREKAWALLLALLALVAFFLFKPSPLPAQAKKVPPPPAPGAVLGKGEPSRGLVLWWRCSACQRLISLMESEIAQGASFRGAFGVYLVDLSEGDAETTRYYLCLVRTGEDPWKALLAVEREVRRGGALRVPPSCPRVDRERKEWKAYFDAIGVTWTPAVLSKRGETWYLEPPKGETYTNFLTDILDKGR